MRSVFVGWTDHGRSRGIAEALGAENLVVVSETRNIVLGYVVKMCKTYRELRRRRPAAVLFMQPPAPLLVVVWMYSIFHRSTLLVGDLHSGFFNDAKWTWFTRTGLRLLRRHAVLVTNSVMASRARAEVGNVLVLHDPLSEDRVMQGRAVGDAPYILFPLSFAADEPVEAILDAASRIRDSGSAVEFWLTGRAPKAVQDRAPANVRLLGWVADEDYPDVVAGALAVAALTTRNHTMQRAGYEALQWGVPVVASDWTVLRDYFEDAALYVKPDGSDISEAAMVMPSMASEMRATVARVRSKRLREQRDALAALAALVDRA